MAQSGEAGVAWHRKDEQIKAGKTMRLTATFKNIDDAIGFAKQLVEDFKIGSCVDPGAFTVTFEVVPWAGPKPSVLTTLARQHHGTLGFPRPE